jgi:hypothetical protein
VFVVSGRSGGYLLTDCPVLTYAFSLPAHLKIQYNQPKCQQQQQTSTLQDSIWVCCLKSGNRSCTLRQTGPLPPYSRGNPGTAKAISSLSLSCDDPIPSHRFISPMKSKSLETRLTFKQPSHSLPNLLRKSWQQAQRSSFTLLRLAYP